MGAHPLLHVRSHIPSTPRLGLSWPRYLQPDNADSDRERAHGFPRVLRPHPRPEKKKRPPQNQPSISSEASTLLGHVCAGSAPGRAGTEHGLPHPRDSRWGYPLVQAPPETQCLDGCHLSQSPGPPFPSPQPSQIWVGAAETDGLASTHHTAATAGLASPLCRAPGLHLSWEARLSEARPLRPKPSLLSAPPPGRRGHCHQPQPQATLERGWAFWHNPRALSVVFPRQAGLRDQEQVAGNVRAEGVARGRFGPRALR